MRVLVAVRCWSTTRTVRCLNLAAHRPDPVPPGTARHIVPTQHPLAPPATPSRCPAGRAGVRCGAGVGMSCREGRCAAAKRGQVCPHRTPFAPSGDATRGRETASPTRRPPGRTPAGSLRCMPPSRPGARWHARPSSYRRAVRLRRQPPLRSHSQMHSQAQPHAPPAASSRQERRR